MNQLTHSDRVWLRTAWTAENRRSRARRLRMSTLVVLCGLAAAFCAAWMAWRAA